jgi:Phospholipase_D-nuclease N-terminal
MPWLWNASVLLFVFIPLTLMWIYALVDVFLNPGLSALARVLWLLVILLMPLFGFLAYLMFRPEREPPVLVRSTTVRASSPAEEVAKADDLRRSGTITAEKVERLRGRASG